MIARAVYAENQVTQGRIFTRSSGASGHEEINLCVIDKPAADLVATISIPGDRQPPIAFQGQPFGYMQAGASDDITFAASVTAEVIRARYSVATPDALPPTPPPPGQLLADRLALDLDASYLADQLGLRSVPVVGNATPVAGAATSANVSASFSALHREFAPLLDIEPAGDETTEGAITAPADTFRNVCFLIDSLTGDRIQDALRFPIYARLSSSVPVVAGSGTFVQAATTLNGVGTNFPADLQEGDLILAPDGQRYEVDTITGLTTLELTTAYQGVGTGLVAITALRFTADFYTRSSGSEVAAPLPSAQSVRLFFPAWFRTDRSVFDASLFMKRTGELPATPEATDLVRGRIRMAIDGSNAGALHTVGASGSPVSGGPNWHTLNFTGINASVVAAPGSPGVANIVVPGNPGPPGPGAIQGDPGDTGPPGPGANQHNPFEIKGTPDGPGGIATLTVNFLSGSPPMSLPLVHITGGFGSYEFSDQFQAKSGFEILGISIDPTIGVSTSATITADLEHKLPTGGNFSTLTRLFLGASA